MSYGWIVDVDHLAIDPVAESSVGVVGPRGVDAGMMLCLREGSAECKRWRCKDDDGNVYYEGRLIGEESFGPLDDFASPNAGATTIEYLNQETQTWSVL